MIGVKEERNYLTFRALVLRKCVSPSSKRSPFALTTASRSTEASALVSFNVGLFCTLFNSFETKFSSFTSDWLACSVLQLFQPIKGYGNSYATTKKENLCTNMVWCKLHFDSLVPGRFVQPLFTFSYNEIINNLDKF